ncbi:MAG: amidase [Pseudomonadota bacterium]
MLNADEYRSLDALGLGELIAVGDVSAKEVTEVAIAQIERTDPAVNAVVHKCFERAREQASLIKSTQGPLSGVPFLLKDLMIGLKGVPLGNGSRAYAGYLSPVTSTLAQRYLEAGLVVVGKTNTPEFGLMATTEPQALGVTRNPWDLTRIAGGSSGGSGAAVASGMVPAAHGGDGGGSIRIPSSCCGLFGLKPSRGRMPQATAYHVWLDGVVEHALTRTVRDSAALLDVSYDRGANLPGPEKSFLEDLGGRLRKLRIAFSAKPYLCDRFASECERGLANTVALCSGLGHELIESKPPIDQGRFVEAFVKVLCGEVAAEIMQTNAVLGRKTTRQDYEAGTWALALIGGRLSAGELVQAHRDIQEISAAFRRWTQNFDLVLAPTLAKPPVKLGTLLPSRTDEIAMKVLGAFGAGSLMRKVGALEKVATETFSFIPSTPLFNMSGQPAMSVPLHWSADGLPIGMQFGAQVGQESLLLGFARQLEDAAPWFQRVPEYPR